MQSTTIVLMKKISYVFASRLGSKALPESNVLYIVRAATCQSLTFHSHDFANLRNLYLRHQSSMYGKLLLIAQSNEILGTLDPCP
jgi:hypothetical protein